jgi:hypothetical protein
LRLILCSPQGSPRPARTSERALYQWLHRSATVDLPQTLTFRLTAPGHRVRRAGEKDAMDEPSETMLSWFEDDELTDCPSCGERKIVPSHLRDGLAVCAACGVVAKPTPD